MLELLDILSEMWPEAFPKEFVRIKMEIYSFFINAKALSFTSCFIFLISFS